MKTASTLIFPDVICTTGGPSTVKHYVWELHFHKTINWDFTAIIPYTKMFQIGEFDTEPVGNKTRIFVDYHWYLLLFTTFTAVAIHFM